MAIKDMLLPELAESVVEGEILKWMVNEGDTIALEQPIVEVMTDKVTVELPATFAGVLVKKLVQEGAVVAVHAPIAQIDDGVGGAAAAPSSVAPAGAATTATPAATATLENADMAAVTPNESQKPALGADMSADSSAVGSAYDGGVKKATSMDFGSVKGGSSAGGQAQAGTNKFGRALATPAARQNAREAGVDIMTVPGSGPNGRVNTVDVQNYLSSASTQVPVGVSAVGASGVLDKAAPVGPVRSSPSAAQALAVPASSSGAGLDVPAVQYKTPKGYEAREERAPLRGMRKAISRAMVASHLHTVRTLTVDEADLTELVKLRGRLKESAEKQGVKLTYLPFFVKAVAAALKKFPNINSSLDEAAQEIVRKKFYNIGIAVDTEAGLLVPVVRDVDQKSMLDIASSITDLAGKARSGKLSPEESSGGTFSITNMGSAGSLISFPIINAPEAAILGIHTIVERPVSKAGQLEMRQMMYLSLSFDHRLVDGAEGARFVREVCRLLENPETLLLEAI